MEVKRCGWVSNDPLYQAYHDEVWGRPVYDSQELFAKLCLDGQQAGLSWITILKKQQNYEAAFANFDPKIIATFDEQKVEALLQNPGIVRNRLKVNSIIKNAKGDYKIMMSLIYGAGLKLSEALNLKIKDLDIFNGFLFINDKNGKVLRKVPFSKLLKIDLELYLEKVSDIYINDKNNDNTKLSLEEFWLFPSKTLTKNFKTKKNHREHIYTTSVQQAFKRSLKLSNIDKKASIQTLRHSYATHLLESGCDIKIIQKLLGHVNLQTTMIYRSLAQKDILKIVSPLDSF